MNKYKIAREKGNNIINKLKIINQTLGTENLLAYNFSISLLFTLGEVFLEDIAAALAEKYACKKWTMFRYIFE